MLCLGSGAAQCSRRCCDIGRSVGYATKWREVHFVLEVSTSHCTRKFWYIDAICNKELVSDSLLAPFHPSFFLRRNQAVDVVIFRLRHLWFLHKSRSIDGNHNIDHVPSSEFVSCFLDLYSILPMKRELVGKTMI